MFEVILAAAIFVVLAGGIYFSVSTSVSAADQLGRDQIDARQSGSLARFLRSGFLNLPAESEIAVGTRDGGRQGDSVDLVIRRAPGAFRTGALDALGSGVVLSAVPDGQGKSTLSITRFGERLTESELPRYLEEAKWLPLLEKVEALRWKFFDATQQKWTELWERKDVHPELIELTLRRAGEAEQACLFRLPRLSKVPAAQGSPTPSPTPEETP